MPGKFTEKLQVEPWDREDAVFQDGKAEGIKTVVEWIKLHWISRSSPPDGTYEFLISEWQSKLKEWGMEL